MKDPTHLVQLTPENRQQVQAWLVEFDRSWDERRLGVQVRSLPAEGPVRKAALIEMIRIDLQHQWQRGRKAKVEAYLKAFPELGTAETVCADLVLAEYEARRQLSAPADLEEFVRRFPNQAEALRVLADCEPVLPTRMTATPLRPPTLPTAAPVEEASSLPEQFGRYRIIKKLGEGGMGSVHLAHDSQLDRPVALKVPHFTGRESPEALERFGREARAAATIEHPNICPVYDVGEIDGKRYVTMAYIEGRALSDLIRDGKPLSPRTVAILVRKIALALEEAHRKGVVHRDLKPSNVMINQRNEPVVMDFGLAQRQKDVRLTSPGTLLGTPAYMAPEQVQGDVAAMGPCCDIYSLGVILYELLTGQLPFRGSLAEVVGKILTQEPPRPSSHRPDLDPELEAICLKAMAKRPQARFTTMKDLAAALSRSLKKGEGGQARPAADLPVAQVLPSPPMGTTTPNLVPDRTEVIPAGRPAQGPGAWTWVAAAAVLLGVVVYLVVRKDNNPPGPGNTMVQVQIQLPAGMDDPALSFVLDGKPISREKLEGPLDLRPGDYTLEGRRGGQTVLTFRFTVGEKDEGKKLEVPRGEDGAVAGGLPGHAKWDRRGLEADFVIRKESYNEEACLVTWLLEPRRDLQVENGVPGGGPNRSYPVRFLDGEGVELHQTLLQFQPLGELKQGSPTRATLLCRKAFGEDVLKQSKRVVIQNPQPAEEAGKGIQWDEKVLEEFFVIKKPREDTPDGRSVTWLLESKKEITKVFFRARFEDAEKVQLGENLIEFQPPGGVKKGEAVRATLRLRVGGPGNDLFKQTRRIILFRP